MKVEALVDWISEVERYLKYEKIENINMVKLIITNLRGHALVR